MKLLLLLVIFTGFTSNITADNSCSCYSGISGNASLKKKVKYELKKSKAVFSGEVTEINEIQSGVYKGNLEIKFKVINSWKKIKEEIVSVITEPSTKATTPPYVISCGYTFQVGKTYLVYIESQSGENFLTGICSRTRKLIDATEDLEILGKGVAIVRG